MEEAAVMSSPEPNFLYVDDDPLSREIMQLLMCKVLGYSRLTILSDNTDFMDKVRALPAPPNVVFLDIQMRPHSGYEMLHMLRGDEAYRQTRIIAMTASVMATDVDALRAAGFDGLIGKPISRRAFPELLQQILGGQAVWFVS